MRAWPLLLVAACDFSFNPVGTPITGDGPGATPDAPFVYMDAAHAFDDAMVNANLCFGQQGMTGYYFCVGALPSQDLVFSSDATFDTDRCTGTVVTLTGPNQTACVVLGTNVTIDAGVTVNASGSAPFVIAATGDIHINGTLD